MIKTTISVPLILISSAVLHVSALQGHLQGELQLADVTEITKWLLP